MKHGIAFLGIVPVRKEPAHTSEMVTQLLFGETYTVIHAQGNWLQVHCSYDNYEGWIHQTQHTTIPEKEFFQLIRDNSGLALDLAYNATSTHQTIPIPAGSSLPRFDGMSFQINKEKFVFNGQAIQAEGKSPAILERVAMRYLNAPYLWGGRSPLGIDCSGFTQIVFKFCGIALPRDAWQQAENGVTVNFIQEAQAGDLAFFRNSEGKITHTGIILGDGRIIHASGRVRIDKIDHFGIFQAEANKYSHQIKSIKRFF